MTVEVTDVLVNERATWYQNALPSLLFGLRLAPSMLVLAVAYGLLLTQRHAPQFFDESDNFLGGSLIAHGEILYRDYFSHHLPLPYFIAAIPALLGIASIAHLRLFTSLLVLFAWCFILVRFRERVSPVALATLVLGIALALPSFMGNYLLAETIESYMLLVVALYLYAYPDFDLPWRDQIVVALAVYAAAMSTLMSVYPFTAFAGYVVFNRWRRYRTRRPSILKQDARFVAVLLLPFVATLTSLVVSRVLSTFIHDAFVFNEVYYSKYDLSSNPLRILILILRSDYEYFLACLNPRSWIQGDAFLLLADAAAMILLARKRRLAFALAFGAATAVSRGQGSPFHDQGYSLLSYFAVGLTIAEGIRFLSSTTRRLSFSRDGGRRAWNIVGTIVVGLYLAYAAAQFGEIAYGFPLHPQEGYAFRYQRIVTATTHSDDRLWIVPIDFYGYLAAHRLPATRYAFYLPWLADSPRVNAEIRHDLTVTRPPVIIFPRGVGIIRFVGGRAQYMWLDVYGKALREQLDEDYVVADPKDPALSGVLLRKDRARDLRQRLRAAGLMRVPAASP